MPNSKKKREKIQYDGKASSRKREDKQNARTAINSGIRYGTVQGNYLGRTPWETSKAKRLAKRIAAGKTYENWSRSNANKKSRASVSNLEV